MQKTPALTVPFRHCSRTCSEAWGVHYCLAHVTFWWPSYGNILFSIFANMSAKIPLNLTCSTFNDLVWLHSNSLFWNVSTRDCGKKQKNKQTKKKVNIFSQKQIEMKPHLTTGSPAQPCITLEASWLVQLLYSALCSCRSTFGQKGTNQSTKGRSQALSETDRWLLHSPVCGSWWV